MSKHKNFSLLFLRLVMGWLFFYAGITKVLNPEWPAAGYLKGAKFLPELYTRLSSPSILPITNFLNEWGLTLVGAALILGIGVRFSALLGVLLMILYYLPQGFPYPNTHSLIVDEHIVYIGALLVLASNPTSYRLWPSKWHSKK